MISDKVSGPVSGKASKGGNELLAALPLRERENLRQCAEHVTLTQDEILSEPGERIRHVHFPLDGFVALLAGVDGHDALAVGLVGSEGMLGAPLVLGAPISPLRAKVQESGNALRVKAADFIRVLADAPALDRLLRRYLGSRLAQLSQTAACASFHVVEARLACWLLMAHDRAHGDRFYITHDQLSRLLGVRRSGVTTAAGVLQGRHLIRYTRGHVTILDRQGLEAMACSCHQATLDPARLAAAAPSPDVAGDAAESAPQVPPEVAPAVAQGGTAPTPVTRGR